MTDSQPVQLPPRTRDQSISYRQDIINQRERQLLAALQRIAELEQQIAAAEEKGRREMNEEAASKSESCGAIWVAKAIRALLSTPKAGGEL